ERRSDPAARGPTPREENRWRLDQQWKSRGGLRNLSRLPSLPPGWRSFIAGQQENTCLCLECPLPPLYDWKAHTLPRFPATAMFLQHFIALTQSQHRLIRTHQATRQIAVMLFQAV